MDVKKTELQLEVIGKVKEYRLSKNLSQANIAEILGLSSFGLIGNIESPKFSHKYTLRQLYILSQKLEFSFASLFLSINEQNNDNEIDCLVKKMVEYDG